MATLQDGPSNTRNRSNTGAAIRDLCDQWMIDYCAWFSDKAKVSGFYSGKVTESQEDQQTLGLQNHTNMLTGRRVIASAKDETFSLFLSPQTLIAAKLKSFSGTPSERLKQEQTYTRLMDEFLRTEDPLFMDEMESLSDTHVVHGDALVHFPPEDEGWRPVHAEILTDIGSPQNPSDDNFFRWAIMSDIQLADVLKAVAEDKEGWTQHARPFLKKEWNRRYNDIENGISHSAFDDGLQMYSQLTATEWEEHDQATANDLCDFITQRFKCFYFYQKDFDDPANTVVDLYIVARFETRDDETGDPLLYKRKAAYSDVRHALQEFILDGNLGVNSTFSSIKGLGHLNFVPDSLTNLLLSVLQNSAIDKSTPLWQAVNVSDLKLLEKWMNNGYRANSVLPAGLEIVDKGKIGASVGEALNLIGAVQAQSNANAIGHTGTSQGGQEELRVQALSRQQNDSRTSNNRTLNFVRKINSLCKEVGRRIAGTLYDTIPLFDLNSTKDRALMELRERMLEEGVELEWFFPENITFSYVRVAGNGDPQQRRLINEQLLQRIALIPDEERPNVLKEWYAGLSDDWERAEQIFGQGGQRSTDPTQLAFMKIGTMLSIQTPLPVTAEDLPAISLPPAIKTMEDIVKKAEGQGTFDPGKLAGYIAVGQWAQMLVQKLEGLGDRDLAKVYESQIQNLSSRAEAPRKATEEQQARAQDPELAIKEAKLGLDERKVAVSEQALALSAADKQSRSLFQQNRATSADYDKAAKRLEKEERLELDRTRVAKEVAVEAKRLELQAKEQQDDS